MGLTHGASEFTLDEAEHAYSVGLLDLAEQAYEGLLVGGEHNEQVLPRLLEIALRRGAWDQGAKLLQSTELQSDEALPFWEAQVALGLDKTREAEFALTKFLEQSAEHPLALSATLALATLHLDAGRNDEAGELLGPFSRADDVRVDYLKARHALEVGNVDEAINSFERLRENPEGLDKSWLSKVYLGLAIERLAKRPPQRASAAEILRDYLEQFSPSTDDVTAVALLVRAEAFATEAQQEAWKIWVAERNPSLRGLIALEVSKAQASSGKFDPAITTLEAVGQGQSSYEEALVLQARWYFNSGNAKTCLDFIESTAQKALAESEWVHELEVIKGVAQFRLGDVDAALDAFTGVPADLDDNSLSKVALFNSAVLTLSEKDQDRYEGAMRRLYEVAEPAVQNLIGGNAAFLRALLLARMPGSGDRAELALKAFLSEYLIHPRRREAYVARLELALNASPPRTELARRCLDRLREGTEHEGSDVRLDYLDICRALAVGDLEATRSRIRAFRKTHTQTPLLQNVNFRAAELALASKDHTGVVAVLKAQENSPSAGSLRDQQAGFLRAYLAHNRGDHEAALKRWVEVIDLTKEGSSLLARHEQALASCRLGNRADAIDQWDAILLLEPSVPLRVRALLGKGECHSLLATTGSKSGEEAIKQFDEVLSVAGVPAPLREEALYRKGMVHLAMESPSRAVAAFNGVLADFQRRRKDGPVSMEWVYRAGFEDMRLAESQGKYRQAAGRADELASFGGERTEEAKAHATRLLMLDFIF